MNDKLLTFINSLSLEDIYTIKLQPPILWKTGVHKKKQSFFRCKEVYEKQQETFDQLLEARRQELLLEEFKLLNPILLINQLSSSHILIQRKHIPIDDQLIKAIRNKNYIVEGD